MRLRVACLISVSLLAACGCDPGASPATKSGGSNAAPDASSASAPAASAAPSPSAAPNAPTGSGALGSVSATTTAPSKAIAPPLSIDALKLSADDERKLPVSVRAKIQDTFAQITENPSDDQGYAALAAIYWVHGPAEMSIKALKQAIALAPNQFRWHHLLSFPLEKQGDLQAAAAACAQAFELDPKFTRAIQRRAQLMVRIDPKSAMEAVKAAVAADPRDALSMLGMAQCSEAVGDNAGAIEWARKAIAIYPDFAAAHAALSKLLEKSGDAEGAKRHALRAERGGAFPIQDVIQWEALVVGMDLDELTRTAVIHAEQKNFAEADRLIMTAMQMDPTAVGPRRALAAIRMLQARPAQAISTLTRILEEKPEDLDTRAQYAEVLVREKRFDEALAEFQKVLEQRPGNIRIRFAIAQTLYRAGKQPESIGAYKDLIVTAPDFDGPYLALSDIAREKQDFAELERVLRECLKNVPDSTIALNSLAWHLAANRDPAKRKPDEAISLAKRACELTRNEQHEFLDTLAVALAAGGKFDDAQKAIERALGLADRQRAEQALREYRGRLELFRQRKPYFDQ